MSFNLLDFISNAKIADWANYASILSLLISFISLYLIKNVKNSLYEYRYRERYSTLLDSIQKLRSGVTPLTSTSLAHLSSLEQFIPSYWFTLGMKKRCLANKVHILLKHRRQLTSDQVEELKGLLKDWAVFEEP